MQIPIFVEPNYRGSIWARQTLEGILQESAHKKYKALLLEDCDYTSIDLEALFREEHRMVILVGTSISWMPDALTFFAQNGVSCILISYEPSESTAIRGTVRMDYVAAMYMLLTYLSGCGHNRIAMYGFNPNSSADVIKKSCFERWNRQHPHLTGKNTFFNRASLGQCYAEFARARSNFDAVICANDIVAASLLRRLKQDGVRVPEDLFLVSFGNSALSQRVRPSITSVSLDHVEKGRQAVNLYAYLYRQEPSTSVSVRVRSNLTVRQSTDMIPPDAAAMDASQPHMDYANAVDFYSDPEAQQILNAESMLNACDETDLRFLHGLLSGKTYEALENELFLSSSALRYRLKRMMTISGCKNRAELGDFLALCESLGLFSGCMEQPSP